jgi:hypothetical protein
MKPIFRNSMFGFHKEDVASFIAMQNQQFDSKLSEMQAKMDAQAKEFAKREQDLVCDQEELENLRSEKNAHRADVSKIMELADRFASESDELAQAFEDSSLSVESLDGELDAVSERVKKSDAYREKAEKFDRLASVLSEIVSGKTSEEAAEIPVEEPIAFPSSDKATACIVREREVLQKLQATCEELLALVKNWEQTL